MNGKRDSGQHMAVWQKFWAIVCNEWHYLTHGRPPVAIIIFAMPLAFSLLFGCVYRGNVVNNIPFVVYDEDQSKLSRSLIQAYADADRFTYVAQAASEEEMREAIESGQAKMALGIPKDFDKDIRSGLGSDILIMVDSTNNMFGNAALSASQEISRSYSVAVSKSLLESLSLLPDDAIHAAYPVHMGVRILGNPANGYSSFMLSGLMMNGLQIGIMLTIAPAMVTEFFRRRWRGTNPLFISLGKTLPYWCLGLVSFILSLNVVVYGFAVPMRGSWGDAILMAGAFLFFVSSVLHVFSVFCPTRVLALQSPMVYIMPGLLYSGLSWPAFDMSDVASTIGMLMPMTYAGDTLRDILLSGSSPDLWRNVRIMFFGGLGGQILAAAIFALRVRFLGGKGEKRAYAAIEIPRDFSKKIKTGSSSDVLYMANGANIILTNITSSAVSDILADFSNRLATERVALRTGAEVEMVRHVINPVTPHLRVLHNMTQGYMFFFLLGLAMVAFQQGIFFAVGASITNEYEALTAGTQDGAVHGSPWLLLLAKVVYFWFLSMLSYLLVVFLVQNLMGIPLHAPLRELLLLASTFILAAMSFVVLFSACFHKEMEFVRGIIMYPVVAFIFSGYTWPHEAIPTAMQYVADAFPLSFFSNTVRELFLAGYSPHLWHDMGALLIIALICLPLGGWLFAHKIRHYRQQAAQQI